MHKPFRTPEHWWSNKKKPRHERWQKIDSSKNSNNPYIREKSRHNSAVQQPFAHENLCCWAVHGQGRNTNNMENGYIHFVNC